MKSREKKFILQALCPLSSAQLLAEAATSEHPPAAVPAALALAKPWGQEANVPGSHCSGDLCSYSSSFRHPSTTQKNRSQLQHSALLPAACQLCTQTRTLLHSLLPSQTHKFRHPPPRTTFLPPTPHTYSSSPRHPLWCTQKWQSLCLPVSFPNVVWGRAD